MTGELFEIWVYLSSNPLLWLTLTCGVYVLAFGLYERTGMQPFLNPVATSVLVLVSVLWLTDTGYEAYFEGAQFVHFLLGPAVVALAVPLYRNLAQVRRLLLPMLIALLAGSATAIVSALGFAALFGASRESLLSLLPKSVTTPVAMGIAERIGGLPSLTATLVILTGILGAMAARPLLNLIGEKDWRIRGFALGVASHGIGTARAFQVSSMAGTFAGIAMGLNAVLTAVLVPLVVSLL